jgi:5-oxoprolinase (ATP-hydrolysing)
MYEEAAELPINEVDTSSEVGRVVSGYQEVFVSPAGKTSGSRVQTPVVELDRLAPGDVVEGPALIIDATQTIFVNA